jgi:hypothetical protein
MAFTDSAPDASRARTYAAVLIVEVLVLAALWGAGRYFSIL